MPSSAITSISRSTRQREARRIRPPANQYDALDRLLLSMQRSRTRSRNATQLARLAKKAEACLWNAGHSRHSAALTVRQAETKFGPLTLLHVCDDYIPSKVVREGKYYEQEFLEALAHFYAQGSLVLDVGANIGNHTLYFARELGARVAAFEPQPDNVVCLELNTRLNSVQERVTIHRCALGDRPGQVDLSMSIASNYGSFTADPRSNPNADPCCPHPPAAVPVQVMDMLLRSHHPDEQVSIVKIDVEGMELDVLRGSEQTLRRWKPVVACECLDEPTFKRVDDLLSRLGYSVVSVFNATPTFLFCDLTQRSHVERVASFLRDRVISNAIGRRGFVRA